MKLRSCVTPVWVAYSVSTGICPASAAALRPGDVGAGVVDPPSLEQRHPNTEGRLAVTDEDGVEEVRYRFGVRGARPAADDEWLVLTAGV